MKRLLLRLFGCSCANLAWPIRPRGQRVPCRVCLDCGRQYEFNPVNWETSRKPYEPSARKAKVCQLPPPQIPKVRNAYLQVMR